MYANLASGAESGWDYTSRWISRPNDAIRHVYFPLRSLNIINIVPVELNSILYWNEITISRLLNDTGNSTDAVEWEERAKERSEAIYNLMWNETIFGFFDYNITSGEQYKFVPADDDATVSELTGAPAGNMTYFNVAQFYPFWTGAAPPHIKNNPYAVKTAFERVSQYLDSKAGGIPATNLRTGEQWDQPSVWPPLMHILMEGLLNTPPTFGKDDPSYQDIQKLALRLGQRYLDSTFCTWYATGGNTTDFPRLQGLEDEQIGTMFEKYSDNSTNEAGEGGEYEVVEVSGTPHDHGDYPYPNVANYSQGFGWSNGVLIWTVDAFGNNLTRPDCGSIEAAISADRKRSVPRRAVELDPRDAAWTKKFGRRAVNGRR